MIILSNKCGQLGNRLFAFAHLIAVAHNNKLNLINLSFDEYAQYFETTSKDIFCRYPESRSFAAAAWLRSWMFLLNKAILKFLRIIKWSSSPIHAIVIADLPEFAFADNRYFDLHTPAFIDIATKNHFLFLFGRFFRDYRSFESHQSVIRKYFTPINSIQEQVQEYYRKARQNGDTLVGVHIRRGDYNEFANGKYFFSQKDYSRKMKELSQSLGSARLCFIVCSNEEIDESMFDDHVVQKGPGHLVGDMYLLAQCDYIIGPPSTYTLWASFYGDKPLYQIRDINEPITIEKFLKLPPEILYNFSFN